MAAIVPALLPCLSLVVLSFLCARAWPLPPSIHLQEAQPDPSEYEGLGLSHRPDLLEDATYRQIPEMEFLPAARQLQNRMAKKALSIFAHWRPQYAGEPEDALSHSDVISAVSRGGVNRPLGQPLRWG